MMNEVDIEDGNFDTDDDKWLMTMFFQIKKSVVYYNKFFIFLKFFCYPSKDGLLSILNSLILWLFED